MWRKILMGVVAVGLLGFGVGRADAEQVKFAAVNSIAISAATDQIVVTGRPSAGTISFVAAGCLDQGFGAEHSVKAVVIIEPDAPPAATLVPIVPQESLPPGTRLVNFSLITTCSEAGETYGIYVAELASPAAAASALLAAPEGVTLSTDGEAIIKGDGDEDGSAEAVIVQQGGPAVHTTLWSDMPLLAGDRICDFEELWTDDDTGETYYFAYVEW